MTDDDARMPWDGVSSRDLAYNCSKTVCRKQFHRELLCHGMLLRYGAGGTVRVWDGYMDGTMVRVTGNWYVRQSIDDESCGTPPRSQAEQS